MKIYFAHPIDTYGDKIESYAIHFLEHMYPGSEIINPNQPEHQLGYEQYGMDYFKNIVLHCDRVIVLPFEDGSVGAGIGKEIKWALENGIQVNILFPFSKMEELFNIKHIKVLSVEETKVKLCWRYD